MIRPSSRSSAFCALLLAAIPACSGADERADSADPEESIAAAQEGLGTPTCLTSAPGLYCDYDQIANGQPATLYRCGGLNQTATVSAVCADGCQRMPAGTNDRCYTAPAAGWSSATHYRHVATPVQAAVVNGVVAGPSPQSVTGTPWLGDTSSGDGQRMRDAINEVDRWYHAQSPLPAIPIASVPAAETTILRTKLSTYVNATGDADKLIARILAFYNPNATRPTTDDQTLAWFGMRAQCKEYADRVVAAAGGTKKGYTTAGLGGSARRPGMYAFRNDLGHGALVLDIYWDATGTPTQYKLGESNWSTGWSNPKGAVPWMRTVAVGRAVPASDYVVVSSQ
jgi:hypothetical protein